MGYRGHSIATYYIISLASIPAAEASSCHTDLRGRRRCGLSTTAQAGIAIAVVVAVLAIFLLRHLRMRARRAHSTPSTDLESIIPILGPTPSAYNTNGRMIDQTSVPQYPPPIYSPRGISPMVNPPPYAPQVSGPYRHPASIESSAKRDQGG
ncbi:hypothetical protein C8Q78DRAFT_227921 [Trametes maxima]|nr:hypothetical protein C8Q78DRAFT_227921 [Trametes maxima]